MTGTDDIITDAVFTDMVLRLAARWGYGGTVSQRLRFPL